MEIISKGSPNWFSNTEEQKEINWSEEADKIKDLKNQSDWWKVSEGKHKIKILSNGNEYQTEFNNQVRQKVRFDVEINGKPYSWGVNKGRRQKSLYYQLSLVGQSNNGSLKGVDITLIVMGTGKETQYTIQEAIDLMPVVEEPVK